MSDGHSDGFTLVGKKRRGKISKSAPNTRNVLKEKRECNFQFVQSIERGTRVDKAAVINKILLIRDELQSCEFYNSFQVSLFESLREVSRALIETGNVTCAEESLEPHTSPVLEVCECPPKNLQDVATDESRATSCLEHGEDEKLSVQTDCSKHTRRLSPNSGQSSQPQSSWSEDRFVGDLRDEVTKVKGQACGGITGRPVQTVVCYGLGNFSDCAIARYQLALLLLICDALQVKLPNCHLYDPRFTAEDMELLMSLGLKVIQQNEECKRTVCEPTLFYMPHCGKPLYNNLLWANWNAKGLANVIVIGNSFNNIQERLPSRVLQDFRYLHQIIPYTREVPVNNIFRFTDVFNDTSLHLFSPERLQTLPNAFWDRDGEPQYDADAALEIILSK